MSELNDISMADFADDGKKKLSEEKLMAYLQGKLSDAEQHEVEQWLAAEGNMESDAIEGLRQLQPAETLASVNKLNHKLRAAIGEGKRKRRPMKTEQYTWIAVIVVLLLVIIGYIVIRKAM